MAPVNCPQQWGWVFLCHSHSHIQDTIFVKITGKTGAQIGGQCPPSTENIVMSSWRITLVSKGLLIASKKMSSEYKRVYVYGWHDSITIPDDTSLSSQSIFGCKMQLVRTQSRKDQVYCILWIFLMVFAFHLLDMIFSHPSLLPRSWSSGFALNVTYSQISI